MIGGYAGKLLRKIWYALMLLFILSSPFINKKYQREKLEMLSYSIYALILTFLYFALLSGVTFWTGPRIVFPADFAMLISGMMICGYYIEVFRIARGNE